MLPNILMILQILVCIAMVGFVLMQQSEGGALGMGGGPTGFMSARGAGDLLTRITWILFAVFLVISVSMTWLTAREQANSSVIDRTKNLKLEQPLPTAPKPLAPSPLGAPDLSAPVQTGAPGAALPTGLSGLPPAPAAPAQPKQ
jgi:preprotein translocase subunit SecG